MTKETISEKYRNLREDPTKNMLYVIGDAQGEVELLSRMAGDILLRNKQNMPLARNDKLVIMGNFLSQTEATAKQMLDVLKEIKEKSPVDVIIIRGETEHRLVSFRIKNTHFQKSFNDPTLDYNFVNDVKDGMRWIGENTSYFYYGNKYFVTGGGLVSSQPVKPIDKQYVRALPYSYSYNKDAGYPSELTHKVIHGGLNFDKNEKVLIRSNRLIVNTNPHKTKKLSCLIVNDTIGRVEEIYSVDAA